MKQIWFNLSAFVFAAALLVPASLLAQKDEKEKDKEAKVKSDGEQIIITRKAGKNDKVIVEINGDKVTVNGKPLDEYKDKDGDVSVRLNKLRTIEGLRAPGAWSYNGNGNDNFNFDLFSEDANHAMLGVTTEKADQGVEVQSITKESAAAKAGLKENDIITKIDDKKIEDPDDLTKLIRSHKPGDKINITYLRDKKEAKELKS